MRGWRTHHCSLGRAGAAALLGEDGDIVGPTSLMAQMAPNENPPTQADLHV